jgi:hypothetical protein
LARSNGSDQHGRLKLDSLAPPYEELEAEAVVTTRMLQTQMEEAEETM